MYNKRNKQYLGQQLQQKIDNTTVIIFGVGAVGSRLADLLARQGFKLIVVDFDKIEAHNAGTQLYGLNEVGAYKVNALRTRIYQATKQGITVIRKKITEENLHRELRHVETALAVDCFDNREGRHLVRSWAHRKGIPLLHVGLGEDCGQVTWDDRYTLPQDVDENGACDYALALNVIVLAAVTASQTIIQWLRDGTRNSWFITMNDLQITKA